MLPNVFSSAWAQGRGDTSRRFRTIQSGWAQPIAERHHYDRPVPGSDLDDLQAYPGLLEELRDRYTDSGEAIRDRFPTVSDQAMLDYQAGQLFAVKAAFRADAERQHRGR